MWPRRDMQYVYVHVGRHDTPLAYPEMPVATASLGLTVPPLFSSLGLDFFLQVGPPFQVAHDEFFIALPYLLEETQRALYCSIKITVYLSYYAPLSGDK